MIHEVKLVIGGKTPYDLTLEMVPVDFTIRENQKLVGRLTIRKGSVEWRKSGAKGTPLVLTWREFKKHMDSHSRPTRREVKQKRRRLSVK